MEGSRVVMPILFEHFTFGWQALDLIQSRSELCSRELGADVQARLMRGMPALPSGACNDRIDTGAPAQIEDVRKIMRGPFVPYVIVAGNWAVGEWYGGGGGESLYQRRNGTWELVTSGGGAMGVEQMRHYGVPRTDWCSFGIYDAGCR